MSTTNEEQNSMTSSGMISVNGAQLYYEERGEGYPLLLLHAGIADHQMWDDQVDAFARHYRVIRYDHRGMGRSDAPAGPAAFHEDVYALLRALGIARAHLIGCSMGGGMALDCALAHPEAVSALVLSGPGVSGMEIWPTPAEMAIFEEAERATKAGDFDRANDLEVHIWVDGPQRDPARVNPAVRERIRVMNRATFARREEFARIERQELEPPAAGRLDEVRAPTLVIVGQDDCSDIREIAQRAAAGIPGARQVVIADAAHVPNMEHPGEFNRLVLDFLASVPV